MSERTDRAAGKDLLLLVLLALASVTIVVLAAWIRNLKHQSLTTGSPTRADSPVIGEEILDEVGIFYLPVGRPRPSSAGGWILYLFTPDCDFCISNRSAVRALSAQLDPSWSLLAIDVAEWGRQDRIASEIENVASVIEAPPAMQVALRIDRVPTTLVYSSDWRPLGAFRGAFSRALGDRLAPILGLKHLPEPPGNDELDAADRAGTDPDRARQASVCFDTEGLEYSIGKKSAAFGREFRCSSAGAWRALQSDRGSEE